MFILHTIRPTRLVAIFGLALALGTLGFGYAASNSVGETGAGDGQGTISGYTVSNVVYTQNDAGSITQVAFRVAPTSGASAATTAKVKLVSTATTYQDCSLAAVTGSTTAKDATCTITGVTASAADQLRVIATQ